jgi:hypothetical protein
LLREVKLVDDADADDNSLTRARVSILIPFCHRDLSSFLQTDIATWTTYEWLRSS